MPLSQIPTVGPSCNTGILHSIESYNNNTWVFNEQSSNAPQWGSNFVSVPSVKPYLCPGVRQYIDRHITLGCLGPGQC